MSQEPDSVSGDRAAEAPAFDCHPVHMAPGPYDSPDGWWVQRGADPRRRFGLGPAGPRG